MGLVLAIIAIVAYISFILFAFVQPCVNNISYENEEPVKCNIFKEIIYLIILSLGWFLWQ